MKYPEFILELRPLLEEGRNLFDKSALHFDPEFRRWRHNLTVVIGTIENQGYSIECDVTSRDFDIAAYGEFSKKERIEAYNRELQDTLNELETIVTQFDKYGDPKSDSTLTPGRRGDKEPEWPGKITLSWLWRHVPITLWAGLAGLLGAAFLLGVAVGQSKLYAEIEDMWKPAPTVNTTTPNE